VYAKGAEMTEVTDGAQPPVVDELDIIDRLFGWDLEHIPQWAKRRTHGRIIRRGSGEAIDGELQ
jgi:hypothetical protein